MNRLSDDPAVRLAECRGEVEIIAWVDTDGDFYKERCYPNMKAVILLSDHRVRIAGLQAENAALKHIDAPAVLDSLPKRKEVWPQDMVGCAADGAWNDWHEGIMTIVSRLTAENARLQDEVVTQYAKRVAAVQEFGALQSRLTQATAIIDYVDQHIELDAILAADIPAFLEGAAPTTEVEALKAEVDHQTNMKEKNFAVLLDQQQKIRELQYELTKARESIVALQSAMEMMAENSDDPDVVEICCHHLANQSAPACTHEWDINDQGTATTCSSCGARSSDVDAPAAKHQKHCLMLDPEEPDVRCTCVPCVHRFMSLADEPRRCADCDALEPPAAKGDCPECGGTGDGLDTEECQLCKPAAKGGE